MQFSDLALSRRLEGAEGHACAQFAQARRRLFPDSGSEWREYSGAYAVFDGIGSPVTQTFGLGIFEELTAASLDVIERFFLDRGAQVDHEVSPLVGVAALGLLCSRQYRPGHQQGEYLANAKPQARCQCFPGAANSRVCQRGSTPRQKSSRSKNKATMSTARLLVRWLAPYRVDHFSPPRTGPASSSLYRTHVRYSVI